MKGEEFDLQTENTPDFKPVLDPKFQGEKLEEVIGLAEELPFKPKKDLPGPFLNKDNKDKLNG